ncbi:MAG: nucleotidyltransferase [Desulfatibacillum sp.]|nr:nucleotidyltransferase [Desulfatibacillum sp.]
MTLVILAAGVGSRYGGLKQLDAVGPHNQSILDYSIYDALLAGFKRIIFVIRRDIEAPCREFITERYEKRVPCELVFQELDALPNGFSVPEGRVKPWGTGHAVLVCKDAVEEPFCVINADDFYGRTAYMEMASFLKSQANCSDQRHFAMVAFALNNTLSQHGTVSRGVCKVDQENNLVSVTECTGICRTENGMIHDAGEGRQEALTGEEPVSLNFWGFTPRFFSHLDEQFREFVESGATDLKTEFYLPSVVDRLIQENRASVSVLASSERWVGVTYKDDKDHVMQHIKNLTDKGEYPEKLW